MQKARNGLYYAVKIQFWISCSLRRTLSKADSIYPGRVLLERYNSSKAIIEQFSCVQDLGEEGNNTSTEAALMITQQNRRTRILSCFHMRDHTD